jgi:hypothetical protein
MIDYFNYLTAEMNKSYCFKIASNSAPDWAQPHRVRANRRSSGKRVGRSITPLPPVTVSENDGPGIRLPIAGLDVEGDVAVVPEVGVNDVVLFIAAVYAIAAVDWRFA